MIVFLEDHAAFRVSEQGPGDVAIFQLGDGDFAGEGSVGAVEDVLGGDFETGFEVFAGKEEVEGRRSNDDL